MSEGNQLLLDDLLSDDDLRKSRVFNRVYEELRAIAHRYMKSDRMRAAIQPTELVNEACLRLLPSISRDEITTRRFLGFGARAMRQILTDQARKDAAAKRGGDWHRVTLNDVAGPAGSLQVSVLALDAAMNRLQVEDPHLAELTELHYIGGMTGDQLAGHFGTSRRTINRELALARALLLREVDRFESDRG